MSGEQDEGRTSTGGERELKPDGWDQGRRRLPCFQAPGSSKSPTRTGPIGRMATAQQLSQVTLSTLTPAQCGPLTVSWVVRPLPFFRLPGSSADLLAVRRTERRPSAPAIRLLATNPQRILLLPHPLPLLQPRIHQLLQRLDVFPLGSDLQRRPRIDGRLRDGTDDRGFGNRGVCRDCRPCWGVGPVPNGSGGSTR